MVEEREDVLIGMDDGRARALYLYLFEASKSLSKDTDLKQLASFANACLACFLLVCLFAGTLTW